MPNDSAVVTLPHRTTDVGFAAAQAFDLLQRAGKMLSSSELVPAVYRGKVADCALIVEIAQRIGASPLMVANNLDIIQGRPGWRAVFLIASVNTCGRFSALRYEYIGEKGKKDRACRAWAIEKETGARLDGTWIDWPMIEAEGWSKKSGSKWLTMAEQMFIYRAASFWTRAYAPEIALGFPTSEEVGDIIDVTPLREVEAPSRVDALKQTLRQQAEPAAEIQGNALSFAEIAESINKATTGADFDLARDLIRAVKDDTQRDELDAAIEKRLKELAAQAAKK
jgi:hypothetical protein